MSLKKRQEAREVLKRKFVEEYIQRESSKIKDLDYGVVKELLKEKAVEEFERENFISFMNLLPKDGSASEAMISLANAMDTRGAPPILVGDPGEGKTAFIMDLARRSGYKLFILIGSQMDSTDLSGLPIKSKVDGHEDVYVTTYAVQSWQREVIKHKKCIIFMSEHSNTKPDTGASMLALTNERIFPNGEKLPEETVIVLDTNPPELSVNGYEMALPTANRLKHIYWSLSPSMWIEGMRKNWGKIPEDIYEPKWRNIIAEFINVNSSLLKRNLNREVSLMETNGTESERFVLENAYPSPRSWDNLAKEMATFERSIDLGLLSLPLSKDDSIKMMLESNARSLVGQECSVAFSEFYDRTSGKQDILKYYLDLKAFEKLTNINNFDTGSINLINSLVAYAFSNFKEFAKLVEESGLPEDFDDILAGRKERDVAGKLEDSPSSHFLQSFDIFKIVSDNVPSQLATYLIESLSLVNRVIVKARKESQDKMKKSIASIVTEVSMYIREVSESKIKTK